MNKSIRSTGYFWMDAESPAGPAPVDAGAAMDMVHCIQDNSECHISFNVMPDRSVREELRIREFRVGHNWIEAEFDRTYYSAMLNSPSHLTFVAALVQMQKVTYVYSCHRFGFDPDVRSPESLKIWPTNATIIMRDLVRDDERLVHRMDFTGYRKLETRKYMATATSRIGVLHIDATAMIVLLKDPCTPR
jgi:hypothetical protein